MMKVMYVILPICSLFADNLYVMKKILSRKWGKLFALQKIATVNTEQLSTLHTCYTQVQKNLICYAQMLLYGYLTENGQYQTHQTFLSYINHTNLTSIQRLMK